jgi:hypothetical protein
MGLVDTFVVVVAAAAAVVIENNSILGELLNDHR